VGLIILAEEYLLDSIYEKKQTQPREMIGAKVVYGSISDANRAINASGLYLCSSQKRILEYSAGIGNIFKVFRLILQ
jgi:hypothetical protein